MAEISKKYIVQWKGVENGPYSRNELDEMLQREEISLLHRVHVDGKWKSLGEFLGHSLAQGSQLRAEFPTNGVCNEDPVEPSERFPVSPSASPVEQSPSIPEGMDKIMRFGYALCGTAFIACYILSSFSILVAVFGIIPSLIVALYLYLNGGRDTARLQFILGPALGFLGILFFLLVDFAEKSGWLDLR